ncbi:hypothetical protein AM469_006566, partial [Pseudomonas aeruginosa]
MKWTTLWTPGQPSRTAIPNCWFRNEQNKQALHAAERGYQEGAADYLNVLAAQRGVLASQTSLNASATNAALTLVNLYKSLGGGWDPDALTSERQAGG